MNYILNLMIYDLKFYENIILKYWSTFEKNTKIKCPKIKELKESSVVSDRFAAYIKCKAVGEWKCYKNTKTNVYFCNNIPETVFIRVRYNGQFLKPEIVIPSLLHELAHAITPCIKRDGKLDDHGIEFYKSYANMLRWAENEKIYKLTFARRNYHRHSMQSLLEFDKIYLLSADISTGTVNFK